MFADYHMHTSFSADSVYPMEEVVKRAIVLGLDEICFTDHEDYFRNNTSQTVDYKEYYQEYLRVKEKYKGQITIKFGIEFGIQKYNIANYERDFKANDFDFVILSSHEVDDLEYWTGDFQRGKTQKEFNREYYQELFDIIHLYSDYSVLGHLDVIKRYDKNGILDDYINEDLIKGILKKVIEDGKGIEVNTSSFRYQLPDLTPSTTILKWYKELGGTILTIGSDSHKENDLGEKIMEVRETLKTLGFKQFCTFTKMKPTFHSL